MSTRKQKKRGGVKKTRGSVRRLPKGKKEKGALRLKRRKYVRRMLGKENAN